MSALKPGTLCVIIAGCPENIGLVVEVVEHIGVYEDRQDAYVIRTTTVFSSDMGWQRLAAGQF